jgi:hypothetical protein
MDYRVLFAAPLAALVISVSAAQPHLPSPWVPISSGTHGSGGPTYDIGVDPAAEEQEQRSLSIKSLGELGTYGVTLGAAQQQARGYAGKRLRFSGQIRSKGVGTWAGLYMGEGDLSLLIALAGGIESAEKTLPPNGAAGQSPLDAWQDVSVVVQVPATANYVVLGLALMGEGQVWARKLRFEVVGPEVPLTSTRMVGFDWAKAHDNQVQYKKLISTFKPSPLTNLSLD